MNLGVGIALITTFSLWADTPADRASIEAVITSTRSAPANIRGGFELRRVLAPDLDEPFIFPVVPPLEGTRIDSPCGTVLISHEPMGEAVLLPAGMTSPLPGVAPKNHFVTRSVVFHGRNRAVAAATYVQYVYSKFATVTQRETQVELGLTRGRAGWAIDSFRVVK